MFGAAACRKTPADEKRKARPRTQALEAIDAFRTAMGRIGAFEDHPYRGVTEIDLQPTGLDRLEGDLGRAAQAIRAVPLAISQGRGLHAEGDLLLTEHQQAKVPVRDRSNETGSRLMASNLPPMDIAAAARRITTESGEMPPEERTRAGARLLGLQDVGTGLSQAIGGVLESL